MNKTIAILAGDGIGPEVMQEALKVLDCVAEKFGHIFNYHHALIGGAAWDVHGNHFPDETKQVCESSDAILLGSVGGPPEKQMDEKWNGCEIASVLCLRKHFDFNINLRPSKVYPSLSKLCFLRSDIAKQGLDILTVRELSRGIYFGEHKTEKIKGQIIAHDVMEYDEKTIEAIANTAFKAAQSRSQKVTSVDKANVLECSKLWREVVTRVAMNYPNCMLEHMLIDNCAAQLVRQPYSFDVIVTSNMFGDILSDEIAVLAGSIGMSPSASLNSSGFGMYEPSGGSAPDIAEKGIANPIAQILSAAMMLKYSFEMHTEYNAIVAAIEKVLEEGARTADIGNANFISTTKMGKLIVQKI
ncbi:3-isopropylmalate dehydrogenase [Patescibacteria group bacterium]|nr:3-isopropylmalate dehydrogenase [Patescibacteria group bacterium]